MQEKKSRRSNPERSGATRGALVAAARSLFVEKGYAETGTPEIVEAAGVTRGALYHHFADKQALLRAVIEAEAAAVAAEIEGAAPVDLPPLDALKRGGEAFMQAMATPGRTRLMLLDGPAVLGQAEIDRIDLEHGGSAALRLGLGLAMKAGVIRRLPLDALTSALAAAYDRAALAIAGGAPAADHTAVMAAILDGLADR